MSDQHPAAVSWAGDHLGGPVTETRDLLGGTTGRILALTTASGRSGVLRLITEEPWRTHGEGLTTRESVTCSTLADLAADIGGGTGFAAPESLALDARGESCGHPAHLMSRLPGHAAAGPLSPAAYASLAATLAAVHEVTPTVEVRSYQPWAWEPKYVVPALAAHPHVWSSAFELLRGEPPEFEPVFLHRDFSHRNALWRGEVVSGVVDWVETSIGPAALDVAHCCTTLALDHGIDAAGEFAQAYAAATGRAQDPFWDVMDVVGFLPLPGGRLAPTEAAAASRLSVLEDRLVTVMNRI